MRHLKADNASSKGLKNILLACLAGFLLSSCNLFKTVKILKAGYVAQNNFHVEIPFEYRLGLIIIKVNIEGKTYDFLLDSGAPNLISKSLAADIGLKPKSTYKTSDSNDTESTLAFTTLANVTIGGVDFIHTGAAIADLESSQEVACLRIQGVIGANLMRKAIWKIDYVNQKIICTNRLENLKLPSKIEKIPFYTDVLGAPLCDVRVNGILEKDVVIDLGSNGAIELSDKYFEKLKAQTPNLKSITTPGRHSSGLYGTGEMKIQYHAVADQVAYGSVALKNQIVAFAAGSATLGNKFLKNYDLILDFNNKEALLAQQREYDFSKLEGHGFSWMFDRGELVVGALTENSEAEQKGLQIGDRILAVNETDYTQIKAGDWCTLMDNKQTDTVVLIVSNAKQKREVALHKGILLSVK